MLKTSSRTRRIVTGNNQQGKSTIVKDDNGAFFVEMPDIPDWNSSEIWTTQGAPVDPNVSCEINASNYQLLPSKNGSVFRVCRFPPESEILHLMTPEKLKAGWAVKNEENLQKGLDTGRHPMMHKTQTVDYAIILSGSITMILDEEEVELKAGDVVVQRATAHAWANRTNTTCVVAFILFDAI